MKAAQVTAYGSPVVLAEVPDPRIVLPDDVIVRVAGAGICRTDLHILDGQLADAFRPRLPYTLGHENAGYVAEAGPAVSHLAPGDPVIVHPAVTCGHCAACRAGATMYCPTWRFPGVDGWDGGYAGYLRTSARSLVKLAEGVDPAAVAPHADAGLTAIHAVKRLAPHLGPGTSVVLIGFGGLGHLAIQLLRIYTAARVIVVDSSRDRVKWAESYGPDAAFADHPVERVLEETGGAGAHAVLDLVGEHEVPGQAMAMLGKGGVYAIVGYGGQVTLNHLDMINRELTVLGNQIGTHGELSELMALPIRLETRLFPLEQVSVALGEVAAGRILGRAVLIP